jgi:AmmeMemoRadiSam system protein B
LGLAALAAAIATCAGHTAIVASVDFSHVGPKFGDERPADAACLADLADSDGRLLADILRGDPEAFWQRIVHSNNATQVCGFPAIYAALRLAGRGTGRLLAYEAAPEAATRSAVSYAAVQYCYQPATRGLAALPGA